MDILNLVSGGLVSSIMDILKSTGIIKDLEAELKVKELIASQIGQQQNFFLEYFKATVGENEPWYSPSKLFRPFCSFAIIIFYIVARFNGITFTSTDTAIMFAIIGFWFGGRTIEKIFDKN